MSDVAELKTELERLMRDQFKLRVKKASGEMKQNHLFKKIRREIARIKTLLTAKQKGQQ